MYALFENTLFLRLDLNIIQDFLHKFLIDGDSVAIIDHDYTSILILVIIPEARKQTCNGIGRHHCLKTVNTSDYGPLLHDFGLSRTRLWLRVKLE